MKSNIRQKVIENAKDKGQEIQKIYENSAGSNGRIRRILKRILDQIDMLEKDNW